MKTIHIEILFELLGYSDVKAVRNWCAKNDVLVVKTGKTEFVYETEFKLAFEKPLINKLKNMYGDDWENVYNLCRDGDIPSLYILKTGSSVPISTYRKHSETKNRLLNKIKEYEKKNAA